MQKYSVRCLSAFSRAKKYGKRLNPTRFGMKLHKAESHVVAHTNMFPFFEGKLGQDSRSLQMEYAINPMFPLITWPSSCVEMCRRSLKPFKEM